MQSNMAQLWSKSKVERFQEKPPIAPACTQYNPMPPHPGRLKVLPFGTGASDHFYLDSWSSPVGNLQENDTSTNKTSCTIVESTSCKERRPVWGEKQQKELKEKLQSLKFKSDEVMILRRKKRMQRIRQSVLMKQHGALESTKQENSEQRSATVQDIISTSQRGSIEEPAAGEQFELEKGLPLQTSDTADAQEKEQKSYRTRMINQLSKAHSEKMELTSQLKEKCVEINDIRSKLSNLEDKLSCMAGCASKLEGDLEDEKCKGQKSNLALVDLRAEVQQLRCTIEEERNGKENAERLVSELRTEISGLNHQTISRSVTLSENLAQVTKSKEEAEELLNMLKDSSRLFSKALEERSSELESLKTHVESELEVRKTSENRLSQLQSGLELTKNERDEAQRARDVAMVQNQEYVEKMIVLQDQYERALADVKSFVSEKEEMQGVLDAVTIQNREYVEKLVNIQDQCETALANVELVTREKEEMQGALDAVKIQNREYVEKLANIQDQYETALANVELVTRENEEMQGALDAVKIQNREYVEKLANIQDKYETALANVELVTREKEEMQGTLDESSLVQGRLKAEKFDDGHQYVTALAEIELAKRAQADKETELVNIRKQHSKEVIGITHELEEKCKKINQLQASLGISAGLLGSACRQARSLQDELRCEKALKDKADLEVRQLANRLGELQQEMAIPKQLQVGGAAAFSSATTVSKATDIRDRIKKENLELKKRAAVTTEIESQSLNFISDFCNSHPPDVMEMSGTSRAAVQWKEENNTPTII